MERKDRRKKDFTEPTVLVDPKSSSIPSGPNDFTFIMWARQLQKLFGEISLKFTQSKGEFRWKGKTIGIIYGNPGVPYRFYACKNEYEHPLCVDYVIGQQIWKNTFKPAMLKILQAERRSLDNMLDRIRRAKTEYRSSYSEEDLYESQDGPDLNLFF